LRVGHWTGDRLTMGNKSSSQLSNKNLALLARNADMDENQVKQYYAKFMKTGNPRTAKIEKAEFCQIMQKCYPRTYKEELAEDIFRIYDLDNNGSVDFQEFLVIGTIISGGSNEEKLKQIFRIFDRDGDRSVSRAEMKGIVENLFHLIAESRREDKSPKEMAEALMLEMDGDSDGSITEEELVEAFLRQEVFTTLLVNKIMQRALSIQINILKD